jgi:hypothetical protein
MKSSRALAAAFLLALAPLAGCEQNITDENFDRIQAGVTTHEQAKDILGGEGTAEDVSGAEISGAGVLGGSGAPKVRTYTWKEGDKQVILTIADGKVVSKSKRGF